MLIEQRAAIRLGQGVTFAPDEVAANRKLALAETLMRFEDPYRNLARFTQGIREGDLPIIVSNHDNHANVAGMKGTVERLGFRPDYFNFPVAFSMFNGDQGEGIQRGSNGMIRPLEQSGIRFIGVLRPKDIKKYYVPEGRRSEEEKQRDIATSNARLRTILREVDESTGLILFPEGTVEGGRKDESGNRHGMQIVENDLLSTYISVAIRKGRNPLILPVGMVDTNNIAEVESVEPTKKAKIALAAQISLGRLGVMPSVARVVIGDTFGVDEMEAFGVDMKDKNSVTDFIMRQIAQLIPPEARGAYR